MTGTPASSTAIVMVNYCGWEDTIDCVRSLLEMEQPFGIYIVDNQSPDGSDEQIAIWGRQGLADINRDRADRGQTPVRFERVDAGTADPQVVSAGGVGVITLVQAGRNGGFAAGNNVGLRLALDQGFDYFWLLNNDTQVVPDTLLWLVNKMESDRTIGICGSTLVYHAHPHLVQALGGANFSWVRGWAKSLGDGQPVAQPVDETQVEKQLSFINGASMMVSRTFLETIGLMEERYFLYWEEIDWACRMNGKFRLGYASRSIVMHKVGASIGTGLENNQSPLAEFYLVRSQVLFALRFSRRSLPFLCQTLAREIFRRLARHDRAGAARLFNAARGRHYPADRPGVPGRWTRMPAGLG